MSRGSSTRRGFSQEVTGAALMTISATGAIFAERFGPQATSRSAVRPGARRSPNRRSGWRVRPPPRANRGGRHRAAASARRHICPWAAAENAGDHRALAKRSCAHRARSEDRDVAPSAPASCPPGPARDPTSASAAARSLATSRPARSAPARTSGRPASPSPRPAAPETKRPSASMTPIPQPITCSGPCSSPNGIIATPAAADGITTKPITGMARRLPSTA